MKSKKFFSAALSFFIGMGGHNSHFRSRPDFSEYRRG